MSYTNIYACFPHPSRPLFGPPLPFSPIPRGQEPLPFLSIPRGFLILSILEGVGRGMEGKGISLVVSVFCLLLTFYSVLLNHVVGGPEICTSKPLLLSCPNGFTYPIRRTYHGAFPSPRIVFVPLPWTLARSRSGLEDSYQGENRHCWV
jgi:hypothetical protein